MRKPFEPGNTIGKTGGRPKGARNKLARKFLEDCYADWQELADDELDKMIEQLRERLGPPREEPMLIEHIRAAENVN